MKQLPVVQTPAPGSPAGAAQMETAGMTSDPEKTAALKPLIVAALSAVFDPEIPVNIYDLGLIYDVIVDASSRVGIRMTLTAPACPAAQYLPDRVRQTVEAVPEVSEAVVDVVWDPPWSRERMSDAAKLQLGMF